MTSLVSSKTDLNVYLRNGSKVFEEMDRVNSSPIIRIGNDYKYVNTISQPH